MSEPFIAEILMFGGNFAPRGWSFCGGQLLPISQNSALFSLIGTTYGGDGRTTTGLPDLRGRAPMHAGTGPGLSPRREGSKNGQETVVLTELEMPSHAHGATLNLSVQLHAEKGPATTSDPEGNMIASHTANAFKPYNPNEDKAMASQSIRDNNSSVTLNNTGGGQAHNNMQPYLVVNFIIALQGTYPPRN